MSKMSWEDVKNKLVDKFGDRLTYDKVQYINRHSPVIVTCPLHGDFTAYTKYLFNKASTGCDACKKSAIVEKRLKNKEEELRKLRDELLVRNKDYLSGKFEVVEILPKSRVIVKSKYGKHNLYKWYLLSGGRVKIQSSIDMNEYIKNVFKEVHGDLYDYRLVDYKTMKKDLDIVCKIHGVFKQSADTHRTGIGCNKCGKHKAAVARTGVSRYSLDEYLNLCKKSRDDFYSTDYSMLEEPNQIVIGTFRCILHNITYTQKLSSHLNNVKRCERCKLRVRVGYNEQTISKKYSKSLGKFYFIKLTKGDETLFKVGISRRELDKRFSDYILKGYSVEIIEEREDSLLYVYNLEQHIIREFKEYQYFPKTYFGGYTECFSENVYDMFCSNVHQAEEDWNRQCESYCEENGLVMHNNYF